jgi:hypothetical protein
LTVIEIGSRTTVAVVVYSRVDRGKREIVGMAGEAVE